MIDWDKTSIIRNKTKELCQIYFDKVPGSRLKIVSICDNCGKERVVEFRYYRKICHPCAQKGMNNPMYGRIGEKAPGWKCGLSFGKYCKLSNESFKKSVRDNYHNTCYLCGKTKQEEGQNLAVHHVNYNKDCLCGSSCEFVPLCRSCHAKTNQNRQYWEDLIMYYLYPNRYFMTDL